MKLGLHRTLSILEPELRRKHSFADVLLISQKLFKAIKNLFYLIKFQIRLTLSRPCLNPTQSILQNQILLSLYDLHRFKKRK